MAMMAYEDYCNVMCARIDAQFKNMYPEAVARVVSVQKPNIGLRRGISVKTDQNPDIAPTVYMEDFYQAYANGETTFDESFNKLMYRFGGEITLMPMRAVELKDIVDKTKTWESAKNHVTIQALCTSRNRELLERVPHMSFGDISVIYQVVNPLGNNANGAVRITNEILDLYGVSLQQLHACALENSMREQPAVCQNLKDMMRDVFGVEEDTLSTGGEEDIGLYILTNKDRDFGAAALFYPDVLERIGGQIPEGFYILPSSVHEVMILPKNARDRSAIEAMVQEINDMVVSPDEVLSDYVSEYDPLTRKVTWGQAPGMEKQLEQEITPDRHEKGMTI